MPKQALKAGKPAYEKIASAKIGLL